PLDRSRHLWPLCPTTSTISCVQRRRAMRNAAPKNRQDHDTTLSGAAGFAAALVVLLAAAAAPAPLAAQGAVPCTAIVDDAERLACYDRALRGTPPVAPSAAAPPAAS